MKILTVIGARPQFIKAAAISREIEKHQEIEEKIVHTGQHFDKNMSDIFFDEMKIPKPHFNLNINSLSHGAMTGQMLEKIETVLIDEKPDWVMVYGDTNSTIAGALAAKKLHIKVAHIEAGLRSFNMKMPEEINRILTDRISDVLFCPTETAIKNLENEGFKNWNLKIVLSGDVMLDTALFYSDFAKSPLIDLPEKFILATIHRAENTDSPENLKSIFRAFDKISNEIPIVIPLHPRTKKILNSYNISNSNKNLIIIEPVGYLESVYLLKNCSLLMTDSGGMQKEAYFFKKPCLTLREETEWTELIENNYNILVGADFDKIYSNFKKITNLNINFATDLYGKGKASEIIIRNLIKY
jgi:UDP-GlcNAc3NAcA epimerase